jgi:hypothetical protein
VVLALEMIMKSVMVEVEMEDIEPIGLISSASAPELAASA